jgi:hypothetical protein
MTHPRGSIEVFASRHPMTSGSASVTDQSIASLVVLVWFEAEES